MESKYNIRTDLALENGESFKEKNVEISGVTLEEVVDKKFNIKLTKVEIINESGAEAMSKPIGKYVTIEAYDVRDNGWDERRIDNIGLILSRELYHMLPIETKEDIKNISVLVVGLGNRDVTPDSLGPYVVCNLDVNRHIFMMKNKHKRSKGISAMIPGVMAQSGMESAEMVKGIVEQIRPDVVIAIDALAARSTKRLNSTIQIADTGIHPGSGIGNHRKGINKETMGVPVIAIGIPTVIDAATIVSDTMDSMIKILEDASGSSNKGITMILEGFSDRERYQLIRELLEPQIGTLFVTPKDIDESVKYMAETVARGINRLFAI